jgi:hypothetical protein
MATSFAEKIVGSSLGGDRRRGQEIKVLAIHG